MLKIYNQEPDPLGKINKLILHTITIFFYINSYSSLAKLFWKSVKKVLTDVLLFGIIFLDT